MTYAFKTETFEFEYIESSIDSTVLWENHCHARFEMLAVLEGNISIVLEGRNYRLTEGEGILVPPLAYHTVITNRKGTYRRITAMFDPEAIPSVLRPRLLNRDTVIISSSPQIRDLKKICKEKESDFYAPLANSLMIQILYNNAQTELTDSEAEEDSFLKKILSYIEEHLCEKIMLDDLARHCSRSKSSVCHLFEEKMKVSTKQYILQKKMAYAAGLIRDGQNPTSVAVQVGYENYSDFYRMYQKHFGTSPTKNQARPT
ncbi:MAG: helix-turn-helix transcriptional regulator [Clostridia bacterium]|nr:helix-turn-helix transcriptional regulator [Clostridia bacterium]